MENIKIQKLNVETITDILGFDYASINASEENRIKAATSIAAISRGKSKSNNPSKRYLSLMKEAANDVGYGKIDENNGSLNRAGRPIEYIPVAIKFRKISVDKKSLYVFLSVEDDTVLDIIGEDSFMSIIRHSYIKDDIILTNMRALVNNEVDYDLIPFNKKETLEELGLRYFICKMSAPYFVFAQIRTHGQLSQTAVSERVVKDNTYWLPDDLLVRIKDYDFDIESDGSLYPNQKEITTLIKDIRNRLTIGEDEDILKEHILHKLLYDIPPKGGESFFKALGYQKEIYQRWPNHMKIKDWIVGGWLNDPKGWGHFLLEREGYDDIKKSWVQKDTKELANKTKALINDYVITSLEKQYRNEENESNEDY